MEDVVLVGAGGHCKVVLDLIKASYNVIGITDIDLEKEGSDFYGYKIIGNDEKLRYIYMNGTKNAIITVGSTADSRVRQKLFYMLKEIGFNMQNIVSTTAIISKSAVMGEGNTIMDLAVIHADTTIGSNIIINTGAIIEHDCIIGDHVHIAPGAKIAGMVKIGSGSHIGIGAVVIQSLTIGMNCIIGAGAVVIDDVPDNTTVVGVPAKAIKW